MAKECPSYALDVITAVSFNELVASDEVNQAYIHGNSLTLAKTPFLIGPISKYLPDFIKGIPQIKKYKDVFSKWVNKVMQSTGSNEQSLVNLLVNAQDEQSDQKLTYEQIRDNIAIFYSAGHDSTSALLTWIFYYFLKYPDVLKKLQNELDSVLQNTEDKITFEVLEKLPYLHCIIKETLRLKVAVPFITRVTEKDIIAGKYTIPKGIRLFILVDALQRDTKYWSDADSFIPERWLKIDENKAKSDGYYFPFGLGPRSCIGQRLALEEAHIYIALVAKNFNIKLPPQGIGELTIHKGSLSGIPDNLNVILEKRII